MDRLTLPIQELRAGAARDDGRRLATTAAIPAVKGRVQPLATKMTFWLPLRREMTEK